MEYEISKSLAKPKMTREERANLGMEIEDFIGNPVITQFETDILFNDGVLIAGPSGISVDWNKFSEMDRTYYRNERISDHAVDYLKHLGILSPIWKGNYSIHSDGGILCNPRFYLLPVFFTSEHDARLYRNAIAEGAMYSVWIAKGI